MVPLSKLIPNKFSIQSGSSESVEVNTSLIIFSETGKDA